MPKILRLLTHNNPFTFLWILKKIIINFINEQISGQPSDFRIGDFINSEVCVQQTRERECFIVCA